MGRGRPQTTIVPAIAGFVSNKSVGRVITCTKKNSFGSRTPTLAGMKLSWATSRPQKFQATLMFVHGLLWVVWRSSWISKMDPFGFQRISSQPIRGLPEGTVTFFEKKCLLLPARCSPGRLEEYPGVAAFFVANRNLRRRFLANSSSQGRSNCRPQPKAKIQSPR